MKATFSYLEKSIRAETKQALATISQLGKTSKFVMKIFQSQKMTFIIF